MAKAEIIKPSGRTIQLTLSEEEAQVIQSLVGRVTSSKGKGRELTDSVFYALDSVRVESGIYPLTNSIRFKGDK